MLVVPFNGGARPSQETGGSVGASDSYLAFEKWLDSLRKEARQKGISEKILDAALKNVSPISRVVELDRSQPEFILTFRDYINRRVDKKRVKRGRQLLEEHRVLLNEIYAQYGVPPRYIIAFWGIETNFGDYTGKFRVIDALATLAYDQRRSEFFRSQLLDALQIVEEGHVAPDEMKGSWAGAMGQMQFLPSTFNGYAVDYTGNGRKDIWESLPDVFASAANFLSKMGWQRGERWGRQVTLPEDFDRKLASLDIKKPVEKWAELGVRRADGLPLPAVDIEGSIVLPQGSQGPAFLVYDNFRTIMRWNHSVNYAIAVGHLADRIAGMPPNHFK
ncbi:MAG: lytic murein transglycosylase [Desulfobacteraceae bacterium]|nr:lytic murein transglycosylase [Desulfobacteraceae bacterium]